MHPPTGDRKVTMRPDGRLIPGEDYQIGQHYYGDIDAEEQQRGKHQPIVLYYTPAPGHYEPLLSKKARLASRFVSRLSPLLPCPDGSIES